MSIIKDIAHNYSQNNAFAAVAGSLYVAEDILGKVELARIYYSDAESKWSRLAESIKEAHVAYGSCITNWPENAQVKYAEFVQSRYDLYFITALRHYTDKKASKLAELQKSVLSLLPGRDAKRLFNEYDDRLKSHLAYDFVQMLYLSNWPSHWVTNPNKPGHFTLNTRRTMEDALREFKQGKGYKLFNTYPVDIDAIIQSLPVTTDVDWDKYAMTTLPTIMRVD